jgi:glycosyltransferase involved in cell wall biosynthesis
MRIALYYPWVYLTSGAERVLVQMTGNSRHDWTIFTHRFEPENTYPEFAQRRVVELQPRLSVKRTIAATAVNCARAMTGKLPLEDFDAVVVVCEGLGDLLLFRNSNKPAICVCLTPLRIAFDTVYRERWMAGRSAIYGIGLRLGAGCFRYVDRLAWRRYRRVFFISHEVRRRAMDARLVDASRSEVIYPGLGIAANRPGGRREKFFLVPGRIMWTKNIELAIRSFQEFAAQPQFNDWRLVVAGIVDVKSRPYYDRLRALAQGDERISFIVHPSDGELADLYSACSGVLFTAFNEDFGIVPLEAMAAGKPVVAVNSGGPCETVTPGVEGFLEAPEPPAFAARMAEIAGDSQMARRMGTAGIERAKQYDWRTFVSRIDEELDRLSITQRSSEQSRDFIAADVLDRVSGVDR